MNESIRVIPKKQVLKKKLKVAAYARVSTGKDAMLHSLSTQISYYSKIIQERNDWLYVGVYADEAITGTKDSRDEFQRMLDDAKDGKIDLIITKSISRFARNTVTLLSTIRELKQIDVGVYFEKEMIHFLSGDGELMLSILASYAQEESRQVSENVKWRVKKNFKEGKAWNQVVYGYTYDEDSFIILKDEANVVKRIYTMFLSGLGVKTIADKLNNEGILTRRNGKWNKSSIRYILSNYTYTGNLILQTTYRDNYINKKRKINKGELPKYHVEKSHEAIVNLKDYRLVQKELKKRDIQNQKKEKAKTTPFTSLIICDKCGSNYRRKRRGPKTVWHCGEYLDNGKDSCDAKQVPEETLYELSCDVLEIGEFNDYKFLIRVKSIRACDNNILVFGLSDGSIKKRKWEYKSRSESWTPKMREEARRRGLKQWQEK